MIQVNCYPAYQKEVCVLSALLSTMLTLLNLAISIKRLFYFRFLFDHWQCPNIPIFQACLKECLLPIVSKCVQECLQCVQECPLPIVSKCLEVFQCVSASRISLEQTLQPTLFALTRRSFQKLKENTFKIQPNSF